MADVTQVLKSIITKVLKGEKEINQAIASMSSKGILSAKDAEKLKDAISKGGPVSEKYKQTLAGLDEHLAGAGKSLKGEAKISEEVFASLMEGLQKGNITPDQFVLIARAVDDGKLAGGTVSKIVQDYKIFERTNGELERGLRNIKRPKVTARHIQEIIDKSGRSPAISLPPPDVANASPRSRGNRAQTARAAVLP